MLSQATRHLQNAVPRPLFEILRLGRHPRDLTSLFRFATGSAGDLSFGQRLHVLRRMMATTFSVECPHTQQEVLSFMEVILDLPVDGPVVEAGCFKGGSTAKFSLAAKLANRDLLVFDSFEGIPENDEPHGENIYGYPTTFPAGSYRGGLDEVRKNIAAHGELSICTFSKGWFEDTMAGFDEPLAAIYLDVDLESSTRTCIKHLYPLLQPGGVMFSQDGHLPLVIDVFRDDVFWREVVGYQRPHVQGLGTSKLLRVDKPTDEAGSPRH